MTPETPTPIPSVAPVADPLEARARGLVASLAAARYDDARADFDATMKQAASTQMLSGLWQDLVAKLGAYQSVTHVSRTRAGAHDAVVVTCKFARERAGVRVVFDDKGKVAGLQIVPPEGPEARVRPQTPAAPFPYEAREVTYANPADGSTLGGTLTVPRTPAPHPAALLITGSGAQDRDETIFGHKPFLVLADHLTRHGYAVLRVDDRGVGQSNGDTSAATLATHAGDVEAGLAFLRSQPDIDPRRLGLIGHSEGGVIAPMVAARVPVAFIVSLAGSGLPGAELSPMQLRALLEAGGQHTPAAVDALVAEQEKVMAAIVRGAGDEELGRVILAAVTAANAHTTPRLDDAALALRAGAETKAVAHPWFRSFVTTDPRDHWRKVQCPVLALNGDKDTQVPAGPNLDAIAGALAAGGNTRVSRTARPGLNHLFQRARTGLIDEYETITETFDPETLALISGWLDAHVRA